ncbi:MAG: 1,4-beta-xylanase [Acidobacteria bacterium]|nr:MAG: 1,4-beta-xylanase [Acidobacteriota bacterium]PYY07102.1 MAG: 1,4-beta-xylanase [Acidobacteriota bacterium]
MKKAKLLFARILIAVLSTSVALAQRTRWPEQKANSWYAQQPWLVGSNYVPKSAINQLEMWQEATFNPAEIETEFTWAEAMGMNTMRVFLHDLLWQQDAAGFQKRIDQFLMIAARHNIRPLFVLFDSVWDPLPHLGPQHPPIPGVHNSGWVQSPGATALADPTQYPRLKAYVQGVVGAFAEDNRILAWDVWNEPGSNNAGSYPKEELKPQDKIARVTSLLPQVFEWARQANPTQPLTSGVCCVETSPDGANLDELQKIQLRESDITTFHNYSWPESFKQEVMWMKKYNRPVICTEFMARSVGSTFDTILPIAKQERVGAINWGFVAGKTQTYLPWDSWQRPYVLERPPVWHHEVLHPDGTPYRKAEVDLMRQLTGKQ